jgi:hypothetical protein
MVLRTIEKECLGLEVGVEIRVEKNIMFEQLWVCLDLYEAFGWVTIFEKYVESIEYVNHNCMDVLNVLRARMLER